MAPLDGSVWLQYNSNTGFGVSANVKFPIVDGLTGSVEVSNKFGTNNNNTTSYCLGVSPANLSLSYCKSTTAINKQSTESVEPVSTSRKGYTVMYSKKEEGVNQDVVSYFDCPKPMDKEARYKYYGNTLEITDKNQEAQVCKLIPKKEVELPAKETK
jgi:hypothetical protein